MSVHDCPECGHDDMVIAYRADVRTGIPSSYICLSRAHGLKGLRFVLQPA